MVLRNTKRVEEMEHTVTYVSDVGLQVLAASKRWHSDGTFDAAVVLHEESFLQFYMIHALYKNEMIPCVFALLTYKTKEIYRRLIGELKDGASRLKLRLCPETAIPIEYWNHYDNPGARTNNYLEGYNLKMENNINAKPNFWKFIIKIQSEKTESSLKFARLNNGTFRPTRRKKDAIERDNNILKLKCQYLEKK
jgi:hypothetical protein